MISKKIAFTTLDGEAVEKDFLFNLNQQDFVRLELRYDPPTKEENDINPDGSKKTNLQIMYERYVNDKNLEAAYDLLTDLIETSYGVREGDAFVKNRRVNGRDSRADLANFRYHPACEELMIELMNDVDMLMDFFRNLTSVKMSDEAFAKMAETVKKEVNDEISEEGTVLELKESKK
jgi:hypothetical protein